MEEKSSKRLSTREKYKEEIESFTVRENSKITDNGMNHNRGCTDFLCLLVFIGTVVAMCMVSIYCYRQGQFQKIISPVDKNGNFSTLWTDVPTINNSNNVIILGVKIK